MLLGKLHDDVILVQNPSVCRFLVQIRALVIQTSGGLTNLNKKAKTKAWNSGSCIQMSSL